MLLCYRVTVIRSRAEYGLHPPSDPDRTENNPMRINRADRVVIAMTVFSEVLQGPARDHHPLLVGKHNAVLVRIESVFAGTLPGMIYRRAASWALFSHFRVSPPLSESIPGPMLIDPRMQHGSFD